MFDEVVQKLSGTEVSVTAHGEVEALVSREGQELLRQLLAGHLSLRSQRERREPMRGADQELRKYAPEERSRAGVAVRRDRVELRMHGLSGGHRPLDAELNLPPELHSHGVQPMVSWLAAGEAFDTVVTKMEVTNGLMLGKRQVEEMATRAAVDFDAFYASGSSAPAVVGAESSWS